MTLLPPRFRGLDRAKEIEYLTGNVTDAIDLVMGRNSEAVPEPEMAPPAVGEAWATPTPEEPVLAPPPRSTSARGVRFYFAATALMAAGAGVALSSLVGGGPLWPSLLPAAGAVAADAGVEAELAALRRELARLRAAIEAQGRLN